MNLEEIRIIIEKETGKRVNNTMLAKVVNYLQKQKSNHNK